MSRGTRKFELSLKRNGALPGFGEEERNWSKKLISKGAVGMDWGNYSWKKGSQEKIERKTEKQNRVEKESMKTFGGGMEMLRRMT